MHVFQSQSTEIVLLHRCIFASYRNFEFGRNKARQQIARTKFTYMVYLEITFHLVSVSLHGLPGCFWLYHIASGSITLLLALPKVAVGVVIGA